MTDTPPATDQPKPITAGHVTSLAIALSKAFGDDRDARLAWVNEQIAPRSIETMNALYDADYKVLYPLAKALPKHEHDAAPKPRRTAEEVAAAPDGSTAVRVDDLHPTEPLPDNRPAEHEPGVGGARLLGPEIIATSDEPGSPGSVLNWQGANYVPQDLYLAHVHADGQPPAVQEAVRRVMEDIGKVGVGKNGRNEKQNYAFRGIDDFVNSLSPILAKHGVILLPKVGVPEVTQHATSGGGKQFMVVVRVKWSIIGPAGDRMTAVTLGQALDTSDKAANKAMSAAYKYALGQVFAVPNIGWAEGDNDHPEAVLDPEPPAGPTEEERTERWEVLARINARATEQGKTFEQFTEAQRRRVGGMSVEEFRSGPLAGLRGYIERVDAFIAQEAAKTAAAPIRADDSDDPRDTVDPDEPNR